MSIEFRPVLKNINIVNEDLTKITMEVKNRSLDGKFDDLRKYSNKVVTLVVSEETYKVKVPFDRSTNAPQVTYKVNTDGTCEIVKEEQTQLELGQQPTIETRELEVTRTVIDEFIMSNPSIKFYSSIINPRDVLSRLADGEEPKDIATAYDITPITLLNELDKERLNQMGFAHFWNAHKSEITFNKSKQAEAEEPSKESEEE